MEIIAREGDPRAIEFPRLVKGEQSCRFSFSGRKSTIYRMIEVEEEKQNLEPGEHLSNVADIAAG